MLVIREEQMAQFSIAMRTAFTERVVFHLQKDFAAQFGTQVAGEADVASFVERMINKAACYSVVDEQDVEFFIDCAAMLGEDFDRDPRFPWAGEILNRSDLRGAQKMTILHNHLVFAAK